MTAEQLLDFGPPELAIEIYELLSGDGRLSPAEAKNSQSPTTSGAVEAATNTDAPIAGSVAGTPNETASATSLAG